MAKNNPIEIGIHMADRTLAAFGIETPHRVLMTQLGLSNLQADIDEAYAQLQTQETLEQAHRDILVAQYAMLAYYATRCRDRLATRQWVQVPSEEQIALAHAEVEVTTASSNHDDMIDAIAELRTAIRQKQSKFDAIAGTKAGRA
jgi:hypothetical protein